MINVTKKVFFLTTVLPVLKEEIFPKIARKNLLSFLKRKKNLNI